MYEINAISANAHTTCRQPKRLMPRTSQPVNKLLQINNIKIAAININSITASERLQELQHFVDTEGISIPALSEMKVDSSVHPCLFSLKGFHAPELKSRTRKGGDVAVHVKNAAILTYP